MVWDPCEDSCKVCARVYSTELILKVVSKLNRTSILTIQRF